LQTGFPEDEKRNGFCVVVAAVILLLGLRTYGSWLGAHGQEPVVTLSEGNPGEFEKAFDAEAGVPRLVLLLSPT